MNNPDDPTPTALPNPERATVTSDPLSAAETGSGGTHVQPEVPSHFVQPDGLPTVPGFVLLAEIGRGGMGVVYRARDTALHRNVAIKILQDRYPPEGEAARRFVEESQITSQLQHPGIPPIHQVGAIADGRPFLVMKLIKGDTLDKLLKARRAPTNDRGQFLAIFEQICQAVGYAHAHDVVHRDLKPTNIMVGAFGEVQVMDWGLSKSIRDTRPAETRAEVEEIPRTAIGALRDVDSPTRTGSVLGTPAFMPPEQAGGEIAKIDVRSDVFSLGALLCVFLTGRPPYVGERAEAVHLMAIRGELGDALARLGGCGAEPELVALCKRCLSVKQGERPADANELAAAVAGFRSAAEDRARQAELDRVRSEGDRAKAEVEESEKRKRGRVQFALVGAVLLLAWGGVGFAWWRGEQTNERKRADEWALSEQQRIEAAGRARLETEQAFKMKQARDGIATNLKLATDLRKQYKFKPADAALAQAAELAKSAPELLAEVEQARADLAFVVVLDDIRYRKWIWVGGTVTEHFSEKTAPPEYCKAFAARGFDVDRLDPLEFARRVAGSDVRADLVAAIDDWALHEPDAGARNRLLEIARRVDPGAWTDRLRDPASWNNWVALAKLAADADAAPPAALRVLGELMRRTGLDPSAVLTAARAKHPTDFELAFALGQARSQSRSRNQVGPYEAARALRPDNFAVWFNLGIALHVGGDLRGAAAAYQGAIRLDPDLAQAHISRAIAVAARSDKEGVEISAKIGIVPEDILSNTADAIEAYKRVIRRAPTLPQAHNGLGVALHAGGDVAGAIVAYKEAIRLAPELPQAHTNLGIVAFQQKNYKEAVARARDAIGADSKYSPAHALLGAAFRQTGDVAGSHAALAEAARLEPYRWSPWLANFPPIPVAPPSREIMR